MVRTYQGQYRLVSPWEKAMQNVDENEGILRTGKRTYKDENRVESNLDFSPRPPKLVLPPIKRTSEVKRDLEEEVGKALVRSEDKLNTVWKELALYDTQEKGEINKMTALEVFGRYKVRFFQISANC